MSSHKSPHGAPDTLPMDVANSRLTGAKGVYMMNISPNATIGPAVPVAVENANVEIDAAQNGNSKAVQWGRLFLFPLNPVARQHQSGARVGFAFAFCPGFGQSWGQEQAPENRADDHYAGEHRSLSRHRVAVNCPGWAGPDMLTVAAVVRETLQTTLNFVSWYLHQGADRIVLVFDDVDDPAIPVLAARPEVTCIPATDSFLASVGMTRARRFVRRQNKSVQGIYEGMEDGWLLHVDGDEYLYLEGRSIAEELAAAPLSCRGISFLPAEHINTPSEQACQHFRLLMGRDEVRLIYGERAGVFQRRRGLTGHSEGKAATRAGIDGLIMRQHYMHYLDSSVAVDRAMGQAEGAYLLHFVDQGFDIWRAKLPWRLSGSGYAAGLGNLLREALAAEDEQGLQELYDLMHVFERERLDQLRTVGAHLQLDLDLDGLRASYFPQRDTKADQAVSYVA